MSWLTEPDSDWESDPADEPPNRLRLVALLIGAWLAVSVVVLIVLLVVNGRHSNTTTTGGAATSGASRTSTAPSTTAGLPAGWTQRAADDQTNCAAHAYGRVAAFFAQTPCTGVHRLLATTSTAGRAIVIASNTVTFANGDQAKRYLALVNADGTGNIADLLREGVRYSGGPTALPISAFASVQQGNTVRVAEAGYVAGTSSPSDPTLLATAKLGI